VPGTQTYEAGLVLAGTQSDLEYSVSTGIVRVTLGGPVAALNRIDPALFTMTLDVAALQPGVHQLQPIPNLQAGLTVITVDPNTVTVTVSSRGSPTSPSATP